MKLLDAYSIAHLKRKHQLSYEKKTLKTGNINETRMLLSTVLVNLSLHTNIKTGREA